MPRKTKKLQPITQNLHQLVDPETYPLFAGQVGIFLAKSKLQQSFCQ
jgi:hypothetical protein